VPSIGVKYWGTYVRVPDNHQVIPDQIYESRGSFNQPIPENIALGLLKDWRDRLYVTQGIVSNYIAVDGTNFVIQWKVPKSAFKTTATASTTETVTAVIEWGAVIATVLKIVLAAVIAAGIVYGLSALAAVIHETGQVLSILGPENVSMITTVLFMFAFIMMFGPFIETIAELPKRLMPKKEKEKEEKEKE
jgi:hypothetical protein